MRLDSSLDVDPSVGLVEADELRFKQVVINLLSNAVKFTPDGGKVTVAARVDGREVVVTVTDTGVGVAPADRERIFESFQQGPRGTSTQEGTGLGLTLCRRIVGLMGGRMWLESEVGVGSTFAFTVPIGRQTPRTDASSNGVRNCAPRVLVIEDDRPSVDLLTAYLESAGFEVSIAHDGPSGLDAIRRRAAGGRHPGRPAAPHGRVGRAARDQSGPRDGGIPVVVVSVLDERAKGLSLGAAEYLVKPISRDELLAALARR